MDLTKLNKKEVKVLKLRCQENPIHKIATRLGINDSDVYRVQAHAFNKLDVKGEKQERFNNFKEAGGCRELDKVEEKDLVDWEKRKYEIFGGQVETTRFPSVYLGLILVILLIVGAYWLGTRQRFPETDPTSQNGVLTEASSVSPLITTTETSEPTPEISETPLEVVVIPPTSTLDFSTEIPTTTPTPTPIPTLSPILFEDDFNEGLLTEWDVVFGEPLYVQGKLTSSGDLIMFTGDETWTDYSVSVEGVCSVAERFGGSGCLLIVRARDTQNYIAWMFYKYEGWWITVTDGVVTKITNSGYRSVATNPKFLRITVEGNKFTTFINNNLISTIINMDYSSGGVGIKLRTGTSIDNLVIRRLP
jgi:hypothetical protein